MQEMTTAQWREFICEGTRTGKLATVRKDGRAQVVPIWFILDRDELVFTVGSSSAKAHAMRRTGRAALCVDDERPPYAFVMIEGPVTISEDLDEMLPFATRIGGRYMGAERAEQFGRRNAVHGEALVRLAPERVLARSGIAD